MKITKDTKYFTIAELIRRLPQEKVEEIKRVAVSTLLGEGGYMNLTIGQLSQIVDSRNITAIISTDKMLEMTVFEYFVIDGIKIFLDGYIQKLERLVPPMTAEERMAQNSCLKTTMTEGFLIFVRDYFNLPNFRVAEDITLAELLIAKKDSYNKAIFQREMANIMNKKLKKKR